MHACPQISVETFKHKKDLLVRQAGLSLCQGLTSIIHKKCFFLYCLKSTPECCVDHPHWNPLCTSMLQAATKHMHRHKERNVSISKLIGCTSLYQTSFNIITLMCSVPLQTEAVLMVCSWQTACLQCELHRIITVAPACTFSAFTQWMSIYQDSGVFHI